MANKLQVKARYRALSNAVYHRSYEIGSPIEVQVFPDSMTILSHPGPVPLVNAKVLASQRRIIAREYRNRVCIRASTLSGLDSMVV